MHAALSLLYRRCRRFLGVTIALLLMMIYLTITQDSFLTSTNLTNILRSMTVLFMVSIGNTFVLLTAGSTCRSARCSRSAVSRWRACSATA